MYYFLAALISAVMVAIPMIFTGKKVIRNAVTLGLLAFLSNSLFFYLATPSTAYPLFGLIGFATFIWLIVGAFVANSFDGYYHWKRDFNWFAILAPVLVAVVYVVVFLANAPIFRAHEYASMLGHVEESVWTQDVQPKDPAHMRMASSENATYQAQKIIGSAGAVGSQFEIGVMTLQMIGKELWFVAPLDYSGFSVWLNTDGAPGYVKISGEDPHRQAELVRFPADKKASYMPGAFFGYNLERHLRNNGYLGYGLTEFTFEIDEEGNPWWVITVFKPTIGWSGDRVLGVVIVNPFTGDHKFHKIGEVPNWVDRVVPGEFIQNYLDWKGMFSGGWLNSWWGKLNLTKADSTLLIYGTGDQPEWVIDITSASRADDSLVALVYTNSRTGKSVRYQMPGGGTTSAILDAVNKNQEIQYRHLHGAAVQLYNVYGHPTAVVSVLNESHAYQGMAMVAINDIQTVAVGKNQYEALRNYEKLLADAGRRVAVDKGREIKFIEGVVDRFSSEVISNSGSVYYLHLAGIPHLFTAGAGSSPELSVTRAGDRVKIGIYSSDRDVIPMHEFDNLSLELSQSRVQGEVEKKAKEPRQERESTEDTRAIMERLKKLSPEELKELGKKVPKK